MRRVAIFVLFGVVTAAFAADLRRSGFDDMSAATQALQKDDTLNPAMLWVKDGEAEWNAATGPDAKSCATCHGDARVSMVGVAARYPQFDALLNRPINLQQRIEQCRSKQPEPTVKRPDPQSSLNLESYIARQSRGLKIEASGDPRMLPWRARGESLYRQRIGQLDLSCAHCHDDNAGKRLGRNTIPQGHPTGYPIYRLAWQELGGLQRRLRNCMVAVRAEPYAADSAEFAALEVYLAQRANGMISEAPAVRP